MLIVGISGKKRSGKDEAAETILNTLPRGIRIAFADALKIEVANACQISVLDIEANKPLFRTLLQAYGTEFRREYGKNKNYWIDQLAKAVACYSGTKIEYIVVPDVRFVNELEFVQKNGIAIRIESKTRCNMDDNHPSEVELDGSQFDYTITNDGTLEEFRTNIARIANKVIAQRL